MTTSDTLPPFRVSVQSSQIAVRTALKALLDGLAPLELDVEESGTVELVMAEALNNIVEHAYPEGDAAGPINIMCKHAKDGLHLKVVDHGRAMPDGQTPVGAAVDVDVALQDMPEGGFGWFLIKDLAKEVRYERSDWENQLMFRLAVATKGSAA
ncbi:ATP-binding protein [uncultured Tateyamaria sp.]|uniref:ATP-binding protein n=1 Tax=Tateyamaria sp. TaxID=1929288 RepID=UPI002621EEBE|nr:ATP-binding protein [uncultured Tateyamaria sp.]